jgi:hypothetical protein
MEGFSREIIDLICDDWNNDEQLVIDALVYLYNTTTDDKMIEQIEMVCKDYGYCPDCGNKLSTYEWWETHTELGYNNQEWFSCQMCPCCDRGDIKDYMEEVEE